MSSLTSIVPWSQKLLCDVLHHGDLAVDLTAGKGRDTHVLAEAVGSMGQVVAFDLQAEALEQTRDLLQSHNFSVQSWSDNQVLPRQAGVFLLHACHSAIGDVLQHPVKAIIANLGYLPGGDKSLTTHSTSTRQALQQALSLLSPGGRLAVTVYPAHPGGEEESSAVDQLLSNLSDDQWRVLSLRVANCRVSPYLLVAERTS